VKALPEIEPVFGVQSVRGKPGHREGKQDLQEVITSGGSRLRTVAVVRMSLGWPLLGGPSGWFDGGLFCQLRVCEKVLKLKEREDITET
jgi:hypothetical protein